MGVEIDTADGGAGALPGVLGRRDVALKAIVLAAGYATRLGPLTETIAKPLLPLGGRPMIDHICDKIREVDESTASTS